MENIRKQKCKVNEEMDPEYSGGVNYLGRALT